MQCRPMIDNLLISPLRQNQTGRDFAASHSSVSDGDPDFGESGDFHYGDVGQSREEGEEPQFYRKYFVILFIII